MGALVPAGRDTLARRVLLPAIAALLVGLESVLLLGVRMDDPYIFARYAVHLQRYHDVLWNLGEPRIEGFSSWLWLGVYLLGLSVGAQPVLFAKLAGCLAAAVLAAVVTFRVEAQTRDRAAAAGALAILATAPALPFYAACGMDNIAWALGAFLYLAWLAAAPRATWRHSAVAGAAVLVRPEGVLLLGVLAAVEAVPLRGQGAASRLTRLLAPGVFVLALVTLARRIAFDAWLPNPALAKHLGGPLLLRAWEGLLYVAHGLGVYLAVPLVAALLALGVRSDRNAAGEARPQERSRLLLACAVFTVLSVAFVVAAGTDDVTAFGPDRLLLPALAPAAFLGSEAFRSLRGSRALAALGLVALVVLPRIPAARECAAWVPGTGGLARFVSPGLWLPDEHAASTYLRRETPRGALIAVPWAGRVPFETDLPTLDLLGLNDRTIARTPVRGPLHAGRFNSDYVLSREPYWICPGVWAGSLDPAALATLGDADLARRGAVRGGVRDLLRDARFVHGYETDLLFPATAETGSCFRRRGSAGRVRS